MAIKRYLLLLFCITFIHNFYAQVGTYINGPKDERINIIAYTHATIYIDYQTFVQDATILIEKGIIKQVGKNITIPVQAIKIDCQGKFIYPSFIDMNTSYGILQNQSLPSTNSSFNSNIKGAYPWNDAIKSYQEAHKLVKHDNEKAKEYRSIGFGALLTFQSDGVARGTSTLINLTNKSESASILVEKVATHYSFDKGTSTQEYPGSLMGHISLLRQTFYDANWYDKLLKKDVKELGLASINETKALPRIIETTDKFNALRADKIGDEFGFQFIIKGSGTEYQRLDAIKKTGASFILPLNFPQAFDLEDPIDAENITYVQMKHWEMAPFNPYFLWKSGIPFALTSSNLKDRNHFLAGVRKAIRCGLPTSEALKALTYTPAKLMKVEALVGSLKPGMIANFIVTSDSIFAVESTMLENVVGGDRFVLSNTSTLPDIKGIYQFRLKNKNKKISFPDTLTMSITGNNNNLEVEFLKDTFKVKGTIKQTNEFFVISIEWQKMLYKLSGFKTKNTLSGIGENTLISNFKWEASKELDFVLPAISDSVLKKRATLRRKEDSLLKSIGTFIYPFNAFGLDSVPLTKTVLFKNATVWTSDQKGILKETDVLISNGKIIKIGKINDKADETIDATGKHITPGIIDEHSHIAIDGGVNECTHSITSEVRIGDVLNSENINIYRNLAGGVTSAQLLHGSCNCIGGQSALVKLRWGKSPEEMKIAGLDGFIKFALGENVKQSNWGNGQRIRYPQTRMGVEQTYNDVFTRAKEYETELKNNTQTRRDLQLDAIVEILNKKRFITCHSYVQSEIIMLMRLTEKFGIRVNTFTHILEGYKVADLMKAHGVGASTFADWWAYKWEVKDAIPYNAALMHKVGIVTAINSDDPEMARRLNHEAAKVVKYGGISEEEALKMITINPAKLLHLNTITGSISIGKDADLVVWSDNPLSIYAKCEQTYVDGIRLFDIQENEKMKIRISNEKKRIKNKMLEAKKNNEPTQKPYVTYEQLWDCEDHGSYYKTDND